MIFTTVGSMFPFDRMIRMVDAWAAQNKNYEVMAQIGAGSYEPRNMKWQRIFTPNEYKRIIQSCDLIIAHAGTGSVFTASEYRLPIVLIPRRAAYKEHTTDHQLHTARWLEGKPGIFVAWSDDDLATAIQRAIASRSGLQSLIPQSAPVAFLQRICHFLTAP